MPRVEAVAELTPLSDREMEQILVVFHQYETGLRSGTIKTGDLLPSMQSLGLNPTEQEIIDMGNEVEKKGVIYFDDFCKLILRKFREEDEFEFRKIMFKHFCGTDPLPKEFRAKKYKINQRYIMKDDFIEIMQDINEMFAYADQDKDGKISWTEFQTMIHPPDPPRAPTPHKADFVSFIIDNPAFEEDDNELNDKEKGTEKKDGEKPHTHSHSRHNSASRISECATEHSAASAAANKKKCVICQAKEVKPIVETDISKAATEFAKDSTLLQYSWRNDKAVITEKHIPPACV